MSIMILERVLVLIGSYVLLQVWKSALPISVCLTFEIMYFTMHSWCSGTHYMG